MGLEDRNAQHDKVIVDKYVNPNADYEMVTYDYVMRPFADADSGAITITLPPVAEAKGRFYSIIARQADAANTITIEDRDDSECWAADIILNSKCDRALLYSDGLSWIPLVGVSDWPGASTTNPPGTTAPTTSAQPTSVAPTTLATSVAPTTVL